MADGIEGLQLKKCAWQPELPREPPTRNVQVQLLRLGQTNFIADERYNVLDCILDKIPICEVSNLLCLPLVHFVVAIKYLLRF